MGMPSLLNQERWTVLNYNLPRDSSKGKTPETWLCVDCGFNTAPGIPGRKQTENEILIYGNSPVEYNAESEVYTLQEKVWAKTGLQPMEGCLCIGCVEKRIGRRLEPKDFVADHPFNEMPGTERLLSRRG
jgi:hypothetical protein